MTSLHTLAVQSLMLMGALFLQIPVASAGTVCQDRIGTCDYYQCLEEELQACGRQGYALGYVKKYCEKFVAVDFPEPDSAWSDTIFPDDANPWRDGVLECLQTEMEGLFARRENPDCEEIRDFGFASHPVCYTRSRSFCAITPQNAFRVAMVIGIPSLLQPRFFAQVQATARICVAQLEERIRADERPWVRAQLGQYKGLWQIVATDPRAIGRPSGPVPPLAP